ncbi:uncharacterized protein LOC131638471 [Vicia villosa]|uniref:uncharacterized protein LOC131638471 n=1 Tax=Vicia villosa TaxID=3911 RepID=UPI00273BFA18|nr:uncharacterized protein LOC131638471 [Vicia villosa]
MDDYIVLTIHHSGEFVDGDLRVYEGGEVSELKIDVDTWSYFELTGSLKCLGYRDFEKIYYKDPTFGMQQLTDDAGAFEIADLYKVHLGVDIFIKHTIGQPEFVDPTGLENVVVEEQGVTEEHVRNEEERVVEEMLSKLHEEVNGNSNEAELEDENVVLEAEKVVLEAEKVVLEAEHVVLEAEKDCMENEKDDSSDSGEVDDSMSSDDSEYKYDSALDVEFNDSSGNYEDIDEDELDNLVEQHEDRDEGVKIGSGSESEGLVNGCDSDDSHGVQKKTYPYV